MLRVQATRFWYIKTERGTAALWSHLQLSSFRLIDVFCTHTSSCVLRRVIPCSPSRALLTPAAQFPKKGKTEQIDDWLWGYYSV